MRWLCFFSSRPASVILTHYIIAVDLTTSPNPGDSQLCLRPAVGQRRGAKHAFDMSPPPFHCPPDKRQRGILLQTPSLPSFRLREKIPPSHAERPPRFCRDRQNMCASHYIIELPYCSHLFCFSYTMQVRDLPRKEEFNPHRSVRGLQPA